MGLGSAMVLVLIAAFALFYTVKANPSFFLAQSTSSSTATTTVTYMTPGTATTTLFLDLGAGGAQGADSIVLLECLQASSTNTTLNTAAEYSQDNVTWAQNDLASTTGGVAQINVTLSQSFTWTFASTTIGGGLATSTGPGLAANSACKIVSVPVPTRYIRAILTLPAGSTNGAVWADWIAKRQSP